MEQLDSTDKEKLSTLYRIVVTGEGEESPSLKKQVTNLVRTQSQIKTLLIGIAIGILIGGVILGYFTFSDFKNAVDIVK